ncbi:hypothetical protein BU25DRAFT_450366 [Macroventuria anomochaeta]|uniref:Uncharacterized protein n=1 Tax=Macroventuria anomochaeta TaxID=301207 RepID=A0ACB6RUK0_9PLEO|nr:uncharacterized protein BU25DRAFT_450366 [Macroventuria anomochaeta]KAF2624957.1 hypothetical protein BU25DRAFT_450366 [Macroventuria anomochaeta]
MSRRINCEVRHMDQAAPHSKIVAVLFLSRTTVTSCRSKSASSSRSADTAADRARQETGLQYTSRVPGYLNPLTLRRWTYHAATPVAGYSIIGTFGAVVSQTIVIGMSNVAGATKKSAMAAAIFVAYCVGNIVGPQLIKSQTKAQHYPEL